MWHRLDCLLTMQESATKPILETLATPPLWRDLVKVLTREPRHASSFSLECTDFKNVTFEKFP